MPGMIASHEVNASLVVTSPCYPLGAIPVDKYLPEPVSISIIRELHFCWLANSLRVKVACNKTLSETPYLIVINELGELLSLPLDKNSDEICVGAFLLLKR